MIRDRVRMRVHRILRKYGVDLVPYRDPNERLIALIVASGFKTVIDVGANEGEYIAMLREGGFDGEVVAFEPLPMAFEFMHARYGSDAHWHGYQVGLGRDSDTRTLNIAANGGASSSFLPMDPRHMEAAPHANYTGSADVQVRTLESLAPSLNYPAPAFMKIDTQGTELEVLEGAGDLVGTSILGVQVELSTLQLYRGGSRIHEVLAHLDRRGFVSAWCSAGFKDRSTGELLQFDLTMIHHSLTTR
jgi:FkbM family methyltransferase